MKIFLIDINKEMCDAWEKYFSEFTDVTIVNEDISRYENLHSIECITSPANSYGLMDGGYDLALTMIYGKTLQNAVQNYIAKHYYGEQVVASSFIINIPFSKQRLIHTPTMRIPSPIVDSDIIYNAMRSTLICALDNNVESIIIPAFGGLTGMVPFDMVAKLMAKAYKQIFCNDIKVHSWDDVNKLEKKIACKR